MNTLSGRLHHNLLTIRCPTFFQKDACPITKMVSPRDYGLSRKSMSKNVSAYLQSRKELHSPVFEKITNIDFFKKKNLSLQYFAVLVTT